MSSQEFELPDILDISPAAVAAAEASLDPEVKPPANARVDKNKRNGDEYYRWAETVLIEKAQRSRSESGLTVFFIQAKVRPSGEPDHKNASKRIFTRYRINFKVLAGHEVNEGHEIMNRLSLRSITSLLKATGFLPDDVVSQGLKMAFLTTMFPADVEPTVSPLIEKIVVGTVVNSPDKRDNARQPRVNEIESWLPAPE